MTSGGSFQPQLFYESVVKLEWSWWEWHFRRITTDLYPETI